MSDWERNLESYRNAEREVANLPKLSARDALLMVLSDVSRPSIVAFREAQMISTASAEDLQQALYDLEDDGFVDFRDLEPYLA